MDSVHIGEQQILAINRRYRILRRLGTGGMGTVHLVADSFDDDRLLALKTIRSSFSYAYVNSAFRNEFQAMTTFLHPNVVEVHEFGTLASNQDDFFTMEYVEGNNLVQACQSASLESFYGKAHQIGQALEYIHAQGFIHCDLKPDNIMVRHDGTVKVMDFGLMERATLHQPNILKGSVHYLAPEMVRGDRVDARLDLYSLGALLFRVLTGRHLFEGTSEQVLHQHLHAEPNFDREVQRPVPEPLRPLLRRLLAKSPNQRMRSASEFLLELGRCTGPQRRGLGSELPERYALGSRFVGRAAELAYLQSRVRARVLAPQPGEPVLLLVTGPSGGGKSRLMREVRHYVQLHRARFYQGGSLQNGGQPYLPFAELLRTLVRSMQPGQTDLDSLVSSEFQLHRSPPGGSLHEGRLSLESGQHVSAPEVTQTLPLTLTSPTPSAGPSGAAAVAPSAAHLASRFEALLREHAAALCQIVNEETWLAGLAVEKPRFSQPEQEKAWLMESLCHFLLEVARLQPMVLYLSDLHWADPLSVELLEKLAHSLTAHPLVPLLLCGCSRRDESAGSALEKRIQGLLAQRLAEQVTLQPLKTADVADMLTSMLGPVEEVEEAAERLAARTGGNPFFIETTVHELLSGGAIVRHGSTWRFEAEALHGAWAPRSLNEVLDRMVAQLSEGERALVLLLSVFNRPVSMAVLSAASGMAERRVRELLSGLRRKRFIARGWGEGHSQYSLHHSQLRDYLYKGLEALHRAQLHEAAATALERCAPHLDRFPEELARHFLQAGSLDRAIPYLRRAADQAQRLYDFQRAASLYLEAYQAHRIVAADLAVLIAEASPYTPSQQHIERLELSLPFMQKLGDPRRLASLQGLMGRMYYTLGRHREARHWFTQHMETVQGLPNPGTLMAEALAAIGRTSFFLGSFEEGLAHLERSIESLAGKAGSEESISYSLGMSSLASAYLGLLPKALDMVDASISLAERIRHTTRQALGLTYKGIILSHFGQWSRARPFLEQGRELSQQTGSIIGVGAACGFLGLVMLAEGAVASAIEHCRLGRAQIAQAGSTLLLTPISSHLAEALLAAGDVAGAHQVVQETLPVLEMGERWGESCLYLAAGRVHAARGEAELARHCLERAVAAAREQHSQSFEAKARLALGAWLLSQGEEGARAELEQARALLLSLGMSWYPERAMAVLEGHPLGCCP